MFENDCVLVWFPFTAEFESPGLLLGLFPTSWLEYENAHMCVAFPE